MWKRRKDHFEFYYEGKKVGYVVVDKEMSSSHGHIGIFRSYVNGKCLYVGQGLYNAKLFVENEF